MKGFRDKKATEAKAAELERKAQRLAAGLADPMKQHAKKPLAEHAEDFRRYLAAKGNTPGHVDRTLARLLACLDACRFVRILDMQQSAVVEFLGQLRNEGKSIATANYYLTAVKGFTRWLWKDRRTGIDPLAGMSKLAHADTEIRHGRRDFSPEEFRWLLETVREAKREYRGLTGLDRFALYLTAAGTGFRAAELATLERASFNLDGDRPTVRCQASYSKNRKQVDQPLPPDVAEFLRGYLAGKPAPGPLWPGCWKDDAAEMIRLDMADARGK